MGIDSPLNDSQVVWELEIKFLDTDNIFIGLWGWLWTSPRSCLVYGEVPYGYKEKIKALPLEPEELYILWIDTMPYRGIAPLRFIVRLNDTGIPDRVEYHLSHSIFDYLKLY